MSRLPIALCLVPFALACQSTAAGGKHDAHLRQTLLESVKGLEGAWEKQGPDGSTMRVEFHSSSNGSIVRELMFPGTEHEMTNVYHLDGDGLVMTHYCAMGNQPHMRATRREGKQLAFRCESVSDLDAPDEMYMGELTLEFTDGDHISEHWRTFQQGKLLKDQAVDLDLARVK